MRTFREAGSAMERRSWTRAIASHVLSRTSNKNPDTICKGAWPRDERAFLIAKAATSPTSRSDYPARDIVESFRSIAPGSAALALFSMGLMLDLRGAVTIHIPVVANYPAPPMFVAEGSAGPVMEWSWASTVIGPARKVLLLSAVSGELENAVPETASGVIGRVMAAIANLVVDSAAFGSQLDDGITPTGLLNGVVPIPAAAAGVTAMAEDLGNLVGAIGAAHIDPSNAVYVCGPRESVMIKILAGSTKFDNPVLTTLGLPPKTVACFAPAAVASGWHDAPTIETNKSAAWQMQTTPTDILLAQPPVRSMFQIDAIGIKVRSYCAWGVTTGGAQVVENIAW